jgi:cytochrome oxidase Cu insertion factor (SCO1/SenC/PrrC family)
VSARAKVVLIFTVCAAPFALAALVYHLGWVPGRAANYGELLEPRRLDGPLAPLRGKWVLVILDAASCPSACERKLYVVRQVRLALGKDAERLARLWLLSDATRPVPRLLAAIEGTEVAPATPQLYGAVGADPFAHIYLVDPLGNLMMRFPADPDPSRVIKDLERLMKYSSVG